MQVTAMEEITFWEKAVLKSALVEVTKPIGRMMQKANNQAWAQIPNNLDSINQWSVANNYVSLVIIAPA
jgi:hypothetical protein